jgi:hypothetical protein
MFKSDLILPMMGAPKVVFEQDTGAGSGGGSTVITAGGSSDAGGADTGSGKGGDGGSGDSGGNGGAGSYGDWRDQLPDDLKSNELFKGMDGKTLGDFANNFVELKGQSDKFTLPPEDATDEQRTAWLKERMTDAGFVIPEDVAGYEVGKPTVPDGMYYDNDKVDMFLKNALELGIPKNIVQELVKRNDDAAIAEHIQDKKAAEKAHIALVDAMKKEYGDEYKTEVENSYRAAKAFGGDELFAFLDETIFNGDRLGNHPVFIRTFSNIAKAIGEDKAGAMLNEGGTGETPKNVDAYGNPTLDFSKSMGKD